MCTCIPVHAHMFVLLYVIIHIKIDLFLCLNVYGSLVYVIYQNKQRKDIKSKQIFHIPLSSKI